AVAFAADLERDGFAAADEEAIAAGLDGRRERRLAVRGQKRLREHVRRARGAADAILADVDLAHRRRGRERRLERLVGVEAEGDFAQVALRVLLDGGERADHLGADAATRADDLPAQLEEAGAHRLQADG